MFGFIRGEGFKNTHKKLTWTLLGLFIRMGFFTPSVTTDLALSTKDFKESLGILLKSCLVSVTTFKVFAKKGFKKFLW